MTTTKIGGLAVRRSIEIEAPPERVWEECASAERMRQWFTPAGGVDMNCKRIEYEPHVGGRWITEGVHEGEPFFFDGRVLVYDPPRELSLEMGPFESGGVKGTSVVSFLLEPLSDGVTRVELVHHGFESFGDAAEDTYDGFEGGWTALQLEVIKRIVETGKATG